jgi:hypothetical protein
VTISNLKTVDEYMAIPINMEYFDEYLRQGDPLKKERAEAWRVLLVCRLWMV